MSIIPNPNQDSTGPKIFMVGALEVKSSFYKSGDTKLLSKEFNFKISHVKFSGLVA